jgi:FtsZ-binding cell division protein ZapB
MSIDEITTDERSGAVQLAGALQVKVDEVYERNDSLEAENDSLRTAFEAVARENEHLRKEREKLVRQRDAALRKADLAESKLKVIYAEAGSYFKASAPQKTEAPPPSVVVLNRPS